MTKTTLYNGQQYLATKLLKEPIGYTKHEIDGAYSVIRKSIIDKGVKSPIILNENPERKNVIIHGVQIYRIAKELGISELPVWYHDCSIEEELELRVLLDKKATAELSPSEVVDLIGNLSYEKFFEIEDFVSQVIECELSPVTSSNQNVAAAQSR
ncbi:MAG: hypothetical protein EOO47_09730 [Flavobacterium sp.]|nr:MAG: hypothetical protein EOO47_09730 [Flavobacterium sp.]